MGLAALDVTGLPQAFFFYGTLCHMPLLEAVIGRRPPAEPAILPGYKAVWVAGEAFPMLVPGGTGAEGFVVTGLSDGEIARLDWYEGGYTAVTHEVVASGGRRMAADIFASPEGLPAGDLWRLADWAARWGETVTAAAHDLMRHYGRGAAGLHHARYPQMLIRAGARVRATGSPPTALRFRARPGDVVEHAMSLPYAGYFSVEEHDLSFRRFDGSMSRPVRRAVFVSGDASVVLPYDPVRDRVMVIEQFRAGPYARGDSQPWLVETIAGRVDGGETPEEAALREAREEAGLEIRRLIPALSFYPSPGAKSEYLYTFVGLADLPEDAVRIGGAEAEDEDIRAHVIPFSRLMELVASGEADNAPLIALALWLDRNRAALRAEAEGA